MMQMASSIPPSPMPALKPGQKRKRAATSVSTVGAIQNEPCDPSAKAQETATSSQKSEKARGAQKGDSRDEKRLRLFRAKPPQSFHDVYERATTQRFFVLSRTRCGTPHCPEEFLELTGSTGNIYNVVVAQQPSCDCPQGLTGKQCKHVLYVLSCVLHAPFDLVYQLALLPSELRDIFAKAPPPLDETSTVGEAKDTAQGKRRKAVDGDCPICFAELDGDETATSDAIVWCKAACGQNMHKECFEMWAATKRQSGPGKAGEVTCPFCRSVWQGDEDMVKRIKKTGPVNSDGYVNVSDQLGISAVRDTSTYSRWWSGHPDAYRRRDLEWEEDDF